MDQINPLFVIGIIVAVALFIAYRHGKLTGIAQTLQAKAPAAEASASSFFANLFKSKPAAATAPQVAAPVVPARVATPASVAAALAVPVSRAPMALAPAPAQEPTPVSTADILTALKSAQAQLTALQAQVK
jgi:hypothetical protein